MGWVGGAVVVLTDENLCITPSCEGAPPRLSEGGFRGGWFGFENNVFQNAAAFVQNNVSD